LKNCLQSICSLPVIPVNNLFTSIIASFSSVCYLCSDLEQLRDVNNLYSIPNCLLKWFSSYLSNRHQRVRANQLTSAWKQLNGAMPQGSWLGPLSFLALINDLTTGCLIHKYVDDTTLSEVSESKTQDSYMQAFMENLLDWADSNDMQVNTTKTKEMTVGPLARSDLPILSSLVGTVKRVSSFKVLGVYIESTLSWSLHIDNMVRKSYTKTIFFKNNLKEQVYQVTIFLITTVQLCSQYLSTVFHCGTTP